MQAESEVQRSQEIPERLSKQAATGAKIPAEILKEPVEETENLRVYLNNEFWGIMHREQDALVWRAQIAPEASEGLQKPENRG